MKILLVIFLISVSINFSDGMKLMKPSYQNTTDTPISKTIAPNIYKIINESCIHCHVNGGNHMAMSHINFSDWDSYSPEKKADKAKDMVKMLEKGKMPPKRYRKDHPENIPTEAQIETIKKWAKSLSEN